MTVFKQRGYFFTGILLFWGLLHAGVVEAAIDCFECHDKAAFLKRVTHEPAAEGDCVSCHNPHVARFAGLLQEQGKDLCYSCHADMADAEVGKYIHQPFQKGDCLNCHNPHASDQTGLLNQRLAETCFECHETTNKRFKNPHSPFAKGRCDACHLPHQSSNSNLLVQDSDRLCNNCHSQKSVQNGHPNFPAKLENCGSCHNPHGSDRPGMIRNYLHAPFEDGCQDCHTGKNEPVRIDTCLECHPDVSEKMASSHNHMIRFEENGCVACHSPHAGDDQRLLKGKERHVCGTCHEATFKRHDESNFSHQMTEACNDCHAPHGSNHPAMVKAPINEVCNDCHGQHGIFTHPIGENVFDPRTGQVMTCISCHATKGTDYEFHTRFERKKDLCIQCHAEY